MLSILPHLCLWTAVQPFRLSHLEPEVVLHDDQAFAGWSAVSACKTLVELAGGRAWPLAAPAHLSSHRHDSRQKAHYQASVVYDVAPMLGALGRRGHCVLPGLCDYSTRAN